MPLPDDLRQELADRHLAAERAARRATRRAFVVFLVEMALATALGLFVVGLAFWTNDPELGDVLFKGGAVLWIVGWMVVVHRAWTRAVERGDVER